MRTLFVFTLGLLFLAPATVMAQNNSVARYEKQMYRAVVDLDLNGRTGRQGMALYRTATRGEAALMANAARAAAIQHVDHRINVLNKSSTVSTSTVSGGTMGAPFNWWWLAIPLLLLLLVGLMFATFARGSDRRHRRTVENHGALANRVIDLEEWQVNADQRFGRVDNRLDGHDQLLRQHNDRIAANANQLGGLAEQLRQAREQADERHAVRQQEARNLNAAHNDRWAEQDRINQRQREKNKKVKRALRLQSETNDGLAEQIEGAGQRLWRIGDLIAAR